MSVSLAWSFGGERQTPLPWTLSLGPEFPGAQGWLEAAKEDLEWESAMHLSADFSLGGAYVAAEIDLMISELQAGPSFELSYRTDRANEMGIRAIDGAGQVFQRRVPLKADARLHAITISPSEDEWSEYWGGKGDGVFRGKPVFLAIILNHDAWPDKRPRLEILALETRDKSERGLHAADTIVFDFETPADEIDWRLEQSRIVGIEQSEHTSRALVFARDESEGGLAVAGSSPLFKVTDGLLSVSARSKATLSSPDNSYRLDAAVTFFDSAKTPIGRRSVFELSGETEIVTLEGHASPPSGARFAQLDLVLEKAWGEVWVDDFVVVQRHDETVTKPAIRIESWSDSLGNLFKPGDEITFSLRASGDGPQPSESARLYCFASTYAGARAAPSIQINMDTVTKSPDGWSVEGKVTFASANFEIGKYYAIELTLEDGERKLAQDRYGFSILPPAANNQLSHASVPFTARNWDGRIDEYLRLARRLGIRVVNLWGGWEPHEPYRPWLANVELAAELDLQWIMGSPGMKREAGEANWSNEDLRAGMFTFLKKYADKGLFAISTGNEPHGSDEQVADFVEAYKAIYQGVKAFDQNIEVIASSTGPDERYWKNGLGMWCDSYDFHVYQGNLDIERTFDAYRELMRSYRAEKPVRSTELGLNSLGMPRHVVGSEIWKSLSTFFAQGGNSAAWFGFLYPDPEGTEQGTSGQAHCMFASQYNRYNPKLDAIAYYHFLNQIGDRSYTSSRRFASGSVVHQFRGKDKDSVLVAWNNSSAATLNLPLAEGTAVDVLQIDGTRRALKAGAEGLSIGLDEVPVILVVATPLDLELAGDQQQLTLVDCPVALTRGEEGTLSMESNSAAIVRVTAYFDSGEPLELSAGPDGLWSAELSVEPDETAEARWLEMVAWDREDRPVAQKRARILIRE